jgi:hypothetical protein
LEGFGRARLSNIFGKEDFQPVISLPFLQACRWRAGGCGSIFLFGRSFVPDKWFLGALRPSFARMQTAPRLSKIGY